MDVGGCRGAAPVAVDVGGDTAEGRMSSEGRGAMREIRRAGGGGKGQAGGAGKGLAGEVGPAAAQQP